MMISSSFFFAGRLTAELFDFVYLLFYMSSFFKPFFSQVFNYLNADNLNKDMNVNKNNNFKFDC